MSDDSPDGSVLEYSYTRDGIGFSDNTMIRFFAARTEQPDTPIQIGLATLSVGILDSGELTLDVHECAITLRQLSAWSHSSFGGALLVLEAEARAAGATAITLQIHSEPNLLGDTVEGRLGTRCDAFAIAVKRGYQTDFGSEPASEAARLPYEAPMYPILRKSLQAESVA